MSMKQMIILFLQFVFCVGLIHGQKMHVHMKDGQVHDIEISDIDQITFSEDDPGSVVNEDAILYFEEFVGGGGGIAFTIDETMFTIQGSHIRKWVTDHWEIVYDSGASGLNCIRTFNVEVFNGKAYIIGGQKVSDGNCQLGEGASDKLWIFDPVAKTLVEGASLNYAREVFGSGVADGKIYVLGGWNPAEAPNGENLMEVEVYENETWSLVSYTGEFMPVRSPAYASFGKNIYLFGGCADGDAGIACPCMTQYTQIFDTETLTFSQGTNMILEGRHFSGQHAFVYGMKIYVFGGSTDFSCMIYDDIASYDPDTNFWELLDTRMTVERKSVGSTLLGNQIYIFGGMSCNPPGECTGLPSCIGQDQCAVRGAGNDEVGIFIQED